MAVIPSVTGPATAVEQASADTRVYTEGIVAGLIGATAIAIWFLVIDVVNGHPFYTPTVLNAAFLRGGEGLSAPESIPITLESVLGFTWMHYLVFVVLGFAAAKLLAVAEREPHVGFGIVLLFVVFQCGFFAACMLYAEPVLHALAWTAVLVGNLVAAGAMAAFFWRRHPGLTIEP
jgi:hypothetical protein